MSTSVTAATASLPALPSPAALLRRWLRRRRQAAIVAVVEARLCEDAGLPQPRQAAPRLVMMGGG